MKKIILPLILVICLSCETENKEQTENQASQETSQVETPQSEPTEKPVPVNTSSSDIDSDPLGMYVGAFRAEKYEPGKAPSYSNRITISINRVDAGQVFGHSVVAGNIRPFEGTYTQQSDGSYTITAKEPGDDRYDGTFNFTFKPGSDPKLNGNWVANDKNLAVYERTYELVKKSYEYNPDLELPEEVTYDGLYDTWKGDAEAESLTSSVTEVNASKAVLKKEEVENMYKADLEFIRNAIYARHGYSFKNRRVRYVFDSYVDWYMPVSTDIRDQLTDIERQNIDLLKRYEEHAEEYYDSFGR